jgi:5-formyltetrahydrofolate cyclo-ligase
MARANRSPAQMSLDSNAEKSEWRLRLRAALQSLSQAERDEASARARDLLRWQTAWQRAQAVLLYAAMPGELDLSPLLEEALQAGKAVALPRFDNETGTYQAVEVSHHTGDCAPGKFGILEPGAHCRPMSLKRLDLALAPGLGFDLSGRRLGRGQGFYDRLLAGIAGAKCGVAFDQQVVGRLPAQRHDVSMNFVLTPTRWLEVSKKNAVQS